MADYSKQSVFQPLIPKRLLTAEDWRVIEAFGITIAASPTDMDRVYLYSDNWNSVGYLDSDDGKDETLELDEDDLFACLQAIIRRSNGELIWISQECSYTASEMAPDGFGGSAVFITATDVQYISTSLWLVTRIAEAKSIDTRQQTGNTKASAPLSEKPLLCIVLEGGLVQAVVADRPDALPCECMVIDYDTEGSDPVDILAVLQNNGKAVEAFGHIVPIAVSGIELQPVLEQLTLKR